MGVKTMSYKMQKMICFILAFVILFMGLFYVNPKHSASPYLSFIKQFCLSDSSAKQLISYINSSDETISPSAVQPTRSYPVFCGLVVGASILESSSTVPL